MILVMLLSVAAVIIGSQACQGCHPAIAAAYAETGMARSSGRVESLSLSPAEFTAAGHRYRMENGRLSFEAAGREIEVPMDLFIGSGAQGRTLLSRRDRYLFELPVTW